MYSSEKNIGVQHLCAKVKNLKYRSIGAGAFMRYYRVTMATQTRQNSIFLRLLQILILIVHINNFLFGGMSVWEMYLRGNVNRGTIRRENVRSGNCLFGELSFWELSVGELAVGEMSSGKCSSKK